MRISLIVAVSQNGVIGNRGKIPWNLPADRAYFKNTTMGAPVIMGRKTYESIGRPLPGRKNIILTRDFEYIIPHHECVVVFSPQGAICEARGVGEVFVIGGTEVYLAFLPTVTKIYLTLVHADFEGDAFFPGLDPLEWNEISCTYGRLDEKNNYPHTFLVYERKSA